MPTWSVASMPMTWSAIMVVDVGDGLQHPFAEVAGFVAVPQFQRLALTGRCAGRDRGPSHGARLEENLDFQGRVAA